ncbi:Zn-dependent hydrolase (plasmid) [Deinococcus sp. KNUC1210]|uniref:Zn-dependent hydrolase n=1 Tax=Deinococcus sp. KNUC1210 TaxID=2917691 RepID=UPI001EF0ED07|nr:Zn-dependent hydrolase [Deinococcus sp. KNUC1210]ULH14092.1 Zn-dependent hydrolase [Deinococcus sp. KNUC1210]
MIPQIGAARLLTRLEELAHLTDPARPYTRRAFTPLYEQGRAWLRAEMEQAGLTVTMDAGGNLIGRRAGSTPDAPTLLIGSHTDTVVGGGRFDGILGVLAALEVAHSLHDAGHELTHALEVVDFLSEEPSDYGASCVGSRALAGTLTPELLAQTNAHGETLEHAVRRAGGRPELLHGPLREAGSVAAYLELHIEQGPVLETAGVPIGVVSGIVGIERWELTFGGRPDHAGTTPMTLRQDALVGAAGCVSLLHRLALEADRHAPLVATVGQLRVSPGNSNVIPGEVTLIFEARALDAERLSGFVADFLEQADSLARGADVRLSAKLVSRAAPLVCGVQLQSAVRAACAELNLPCLTLPSGAGHDAMQVGLLAPAGMLFVPSVGGRSHTPEELTREADVLAGARVLLGAVLKLDEALSA